MNELPRGWIMSTVGQAGEVSLGRQRAPQYHHGEGMRPYLRVANVFENRIDTTDVMQMTFSDDEFERYRLRPGDVLLNEGQSPHLLGRPAIYGGDPPDVAFTNSLIRFRAHPGVTPEWALAVFRYYMRSRRFMRESRITTNIAHLSVTRLSGVEFPVPPVAEQRRIIAAIDEQFSRLDAGTAALQRVGHNQKRLRVALMQAAVLGRLTIAVQDIEATAQQALLGVTPMKRRAGRLWGSGSVPQLTEEERTSIPAHWQWSKVSELGLGTDDAVQVGPMSMRSADFAASGIPVLNVGSVQWDWIDESKLNYLPPNIAESFSRYRIQPGDVLFTRSGTVGRAAVANEHHRDWLMTFHLLRVRVDPSVCLPEYLRMVFESAPHVRRQARGAAIGTTRAGFNTRLLAELDVPVPPLPEQIAIVQKVQLHLSQIQGIDFSTLTRKSQILRSSILTAACSGRLVPQDPSEEPASVVLERITSERGSANGHKTVRARSTKGMGEQVTA